ncbi:MAG: hydroxyacylglutathione hydrolase [Burkholderiales bacterium]|nr:hydroxyacylglutathione hydrolase [Burkholderiales bacterium]
MYVGYLNAFTDNYIWFMRNDKEIFIIDPGESTAIVDYIIVNNLKLKAILLTHDHHDHVGGVNEILTHLKVPVYGMCDMVTHSVSDYQIIGLSDKLSVQVIATPGHTYRSVCYLTCGNAMQKQSLFCGDTLFASGCGRVFTGDFLAMFNSLNILSKLSPQIWLYPGHEYTLKNLQFAQFIEPENLLITKRIKLEHNKLVHLSNTLPVTLATELATNPFLRCYDANLVAALSKIVNQQLTPGLECFIKLRELRNNF